MIAMRVTILSWSTGQKERILQIVKAKESTLLLRPVKLTVQQPHPEGRRGGGGGRRRAGRRLGLFGIGGSGGLLTDEEWGMYIQLRRAIMEKFKADSRGEECKVEAIGPITCAEFQQRREF